MRQPLGVDELPDRAVVHRIPRSASSATSPRSVKSRSRQRACSQLRHAPTSFFGRCPPICPAPRCPSAGTAPPRRSPCSPPRRSAPPPAGTTARRERPHRPPSGGLSGVPAHGPKQGRWLLQDRMVWPADRHAIGGPPDEMFRRRGRWISGHGAAAHGGVLAAGGARGRWPRAKVSTMIIRPPQQGQAGRWSATGRLPVRPRHRRGPARARRAGRGLERGWPCGRLRRAGRSGGCGGSPGRTCSRKRRMNSLGGRVMVR